ncbi:MAG: DUF4389 domain-containing protein [Dehalococcoidales bacterium]|nr:DUF4389 domain-containing protein [Dehalococcoidales bacterium]
MAVQNQPYPVTLSVDYPDRKLDRLTSFFRIFVIIPIAIVIALLSSGNIELGKDPFQWTLATGGVVILPLLLMILFRQKYPKWWFDWNLALSRFSLRVGTFLALLRDEYPSTDEEQAVHFNMEYPDVKKDLERGMPLVKWFLAIPHYIVLGFLGIAACFCIIIAWFAILFTGRYPKSFFDFVVGYYRWWYRVFGYAFLMVTDRYPPFDIS